jgi:two-component system, NarL family, sensor histidine kinase UhpB
LDRPLHVLIVEDSEDDAILLLRHLQRDGYTPKYEIVTTEESLVHSLEKGSWDIIISDYVLPELSGLAVLNLTKKKNLDIPCVIISGKITEETAVAAMKAGARDYITKDNLTRLGSVIKRELEESCIRAEYQKMEQALRESSEFKAILLSSSPTAMIVYTPDTSVTYVNSEAEKLTGYSSSECMNLKAPYPWWPKNKIKEYSRVLNEVKAGKTLKGERLFINKNGTKFWANTVHVPITVGKDLAFILTNWVDNTKERAFQEERERFSMKLISAQEEERKRVAQELHDDTAQNLALLCLELDSLLNDKDIPIRIFNKLKNLKEDVNRTMNDVRRYSHALRPGILDYLGLEAALEQLVSDSREPGGLNIKFEVSCIPKRPSNELELVLFRIAQEALNNIRKHSQATTARIHLDFSPEVIKLTVTDNGKGFNPEKAMHSALERGSLGLVGMRERAQLVGADLKIKSQLGKGTAICLEIKNA